MNPFGYNLHTAYTPTFTGRWQDSLVERVNG